MTSTDPIIQLDLAAIWRYLATIADGPNYRRAWARVTRDAGTLVQLSLNASGGDDTGAREVCRRLALGDQDAPPSDALGGWYTFATARTDWIAGQEPPAVDAARQRVRDAGATCVAFHGALTDLAALSLSPRFQDFDADRATAAWVTLAAADARAGGHPTLLNEAIRAQLEADDRLTHTQRVGRVADVLALQTGEHAVNVERLAAVDRSPQLQRFFGDLLLVEVEQLTRLCPAAMPRAATRTVSRLAASARLSAAGAAV